jgi:dihydroxyacetone kinase-like protein
MQKILNDPSKAVQEMLEGFVSAHADLAFHPTNPRVLVRKSEGGNKVGVVSGGGSGHKPAFIGYLGQGLLDAVAVGEIFSSPPAKMFFDAFAAADRGRGVACLYGNYAGDNMNVRIAVEQARKAGIAVRTVVANDDVPSAPGDALGKRRGVAGEVLMWKIGGAMAAMGADLERVVAVTQRAIDNTRSMGVGLSSCIIPEVGKANFHIEPGTMEVGIGHHGEPGIEVAPLETSARIAERMVDVVWNDLSGRKDEEVAVLVSGLGGTSAMELFIAYNDIQKALSSRGARIARTYVGNYFTSLDMQGLTLTVLRLDEELKACLDHPCQSFGLSRMGG